MGKKKVGAAALIGGAILVAAILWFFWRGEEVETVALQEREVVERLVVTGEATPAIQTEVSAETAGRVTAVKAREGQRVEEGAILVELDSEEAEASLRQAEGSLEQAQARLGSLAGERAPASVRNFEEAALNYEAAREELARSEELYEAGVGTRAEMDQRRREAERARLAVERARLQVEETGDGGSSRAEAAAGVAQAQAARDLAALRVRNHTVRAPFSGMVLRREVEQGQVVQPGAVLMVLAGGEGPEVRIEPDEREIGNLRPGLTALVAADAFPEEVIEARVDRIDPAVDRERRTVRAYLELKGEIPEGLRAEMTVSVDLELRRKEGAMVLPRRALRGRATGAPFVLVLEDSRARRREVKVGLSSDEYVEILEGLAGEEAVILGEGVEEGDRVRR